MKKCQQTRKLLEAMKRIGLEITVEKTKCIISHEPILSEEAHHYLNEALYKFKRVKEFECLGTLISQNNK